jgi:hypothetical protein
MATLTGNTVASTYKQLLKVTSEGIGADASAKYIEDGLGTDSALSISTTRVGIGTAAPDATLDVFTTSYNNIRLGEDKDNQSTQRGGITAQPYLSAEQATAGMFMYVDGTGGTQDTSYIQLGGGHGSYNAVESIQFYTATDSVTTTGTQRMIIDSAGDVTVSTGNLVIGTAGKGIDFSATSDGGVTTPSELLDDYEEGTWTPAVSSVYSAFTVGSAGTAVYTGNYVRIGMLVHANFSLNFNTTETLALGDRIVMTGLPFTMTGSVNGVGGGSFIQPGSFSSNAIVVGTTAVNSTDTTQVVIVITKVNGSPALNATPINGSVVYRITNSF